MATNFGTDLQAVEGFRFRKVSGLENLAIALLRRLTTPRGGLFYDLTYGTDLRNFLNRAYAPDDTAITWEIEQRAIAEVMKDPRVYDAGATFEFGTLQDRTGKLVLTIVTAIGPFKLVLKAEEVNSEVIRVEIAY